MIIRCISDTGDALPAMSQDSAVGIDASTQFPVTVGLTYVVFAVTIYLGVAWYYIFDDDGHDWPTWCPAPLFDVSEGSVPPSWQIGYFRFSREDQYPILSLGRGSLVL
jgi:hypothetical protein